MIIKLIVKRMSTNKIKFKIKRNTLISISFYRLKQYKTYINNSEKILIEKN